LLVLLLTVALAACAKSSADTFSGTVLHVPYHAPATELTDTAGKPFSLADSTDKRLTLVFFGYTHCPDECPTTMSTLASAMLQLDDSDRQDVQVVFVTTDPARDTGPVIRRWLDHFSSSFVGVAGRDRRRCPDRQGSSPRVRGLRRHPWHPGAGDGRKEPDPRRVDAGDHRPRVRPRHPPAALLTT
jgi:SCO1/SenC